MNDFDIEESILEEIKSSLGLDVWPGINDTLDDIGADSLDVLEISMTIEEIMKIDIDDDFIESAETIGDFISYATEKYREKQ